MIIAKIGVVAEVKEVGLGLTELTVDIDGDKFKALNYEEFSGRPNIGDRVVVNTTAVELDLGSGGYHIVIWNEKLDRLENGSSGHLMKLRYTPSQRAALSVEEPASRWHEILADADDLDGQPVIACSLHSQLFPVAVTLKKIAPSMRLAYVMTDGGALPCPFSRAVRWLKDNGYICETVSAGHAFGAGLEAVNIYSALMAAKLVAKADITVAVMGPGIAGTGTALGHTGLEQGQIINAVHALKGRPVAALRLSQKDMRNRHYGLSHHSISALTRAALAPAIVPVPEMAEFPDFADLIDARLNESGIPCLHDVHRVNSDVTLQAIEEATAAGAPKAAVMGRGIDEEPAFFLAAGAAAVAASRQAAQSAKGAV